MLFARNLFIRSLFLTFSVFVLLCIFSSATAKDNVAEELASSLQVKLIGGNNDALLFDVKYANKTGHTFSLSVIDENDDACFQNNYSSRDFEKKIRIPRLTDTDYVIFLIRSAKENIQLSYKVNVPTKVKDETVFLKNRELVSYK